VDVKLAIMGATSRISVERIVIELEIPRDSGSLFRLRLNNKVVGEHLTAVQSLARSTSSVSSAAMVPSHMPPVAA
jgi:hypothetical protein